MQVEPLLVSMIYDPNITSNKRTYFQTHQFARSHSRHILLHGSNITLLHCKSNMPPTEAQRLKDVMLFLNLEKIKLAIRCSDKFSLETSFVILQQSSRTSQHIEGLNQKISGVQSLAAWAQPGPTRLSYFILFAQRVWSYSIDKR